MFFTRGVIVVSLVMLGLAASSLSKSTEPGDDELYNQIVTIKGKVTILNHPELGKTAASGMYLVFQRDGCKQCLVATRADLDGNYQILVGRGRYRIIVRNPSPPTYDLLDPDQARYVEARSPVQENQFDIKLKLPSQ